ncbi:MAG: hypothetical protein MJZ28_10230 [Paludibacteraceae bacterium]|nr:hypothetical protein [Paludibacteraceae bacterium]
MYKSTRITSEKVKAIVDAHYEPGRQDRCKLWVYRNIVRKELGISERTFFRCLSRATDDNNKVNTHQLELNFL